MPITYLLVLSAALATQAPQAPQPALSQEQSPRSPDVVVQRPVTPPSGVQAPVPGDRYVIGPQDNLSITVVDEAELTGKFRIDTDGTLTFPYLGRLAAAGLTLEELQARLTNQLRAGY